MAAIGSSSRPAPRSAAATVAVTWVVQDWSLVEAGAAQRPPAVVAGLDDGLDDHRAIEADRQRAVDHQLADRQRPGAERGRAADFGHLEVSGQRKDRLAVDVVVAEEGQAGGVQPGP